VAIKSLDKKMDRDKKIIDILEFFFPKEICKKILYFVGDCNFLANRIQIFFKKNNLDNFLFYHDEFCEKSYLLTSIRIFILEESKRNISETKYFLERKLRFYGWFSLLDNLNKENPKNFVELRKWLLENLNCSEMSVIGL